MTTLHSKTSIGRSPLRLGLLFIPLVFACFALARSAQAVSPEPSEGDLIVNMAEEDDAVAQLGSATVEAATGQAANTPNKREIPLNIRGPFQCAGGNVILSGNLVVRFKHVAVGKVIPISVELEGFRGVAHINRKLVATEVKIIADTRRIFETVPKTGAFSFEFNVTGPGLGAGPDLRILVRYPVRYTFHEGEVKQMDPDSPRVKCQR
jgi:hypothetical protein